jgi:hypothetical protein
MRHNNKSFIKLLHYISMTFVMAFGLMSIIATGGGGGDSGGGTNAEPEDPGSAPQISNLVVSEICHI